MTKLVLMIATAVVSLMSAQAVAGPSISVGGTVVAGEGEYTSVAGLPYQETFNSNCNEDGSPVASPFVNLTGNIALVRGSVGGLYAAPHNDDTCYATVPIEGGSGMATLGLTDAFYGGQLNYFGLYWGSIDTYNSLKFYNLGSLVATVVGSDILGLTNGTSGDQVSEGSNIYVNIQFTGGQTFDSVEFISDGYAFESDNWAFGRTRSNDVPEPASLALLGAGLAGLGWARRRKTA